MVRDECLNDGCGERGQKEGVNVGCGVHLEDEIWTGLWDRSNRKPPHKMAWFTLNRMSKIRQQSLHCRHHTQARISPASLPLHRYHRTQAQKFIFFVTSPHVLLLVLASSISSASCPRLPPLYIVSSILSFVECRCPLLKTGLASSTLETGNRFPSRSDPMRKVSRRPVREPAELWLTGQNSTENIKEGEGTNSSERAPQWRRQPSQPAAARDSTSIPPQQPPPAPAAAAASVGNLRSSLVASLADPFLEKN
ncbi:hypothetical protein PIB30_024223 [Stylosanthes scabra]|uniref:Uncharacterized protein n=1 Tax=Stylosanthes scabra TaxID=79078 RepID=A0ABU6SAF2_9FABA|nr:hypothetical protein [Stylosanthes scabra]